MFAAELVALNLYVILTTTPAASRAVLRATSAVPIVCIGFDPVDELKRLQAKALLIPGPLDQSVKSDMLGGTAARLLKLGEATTRLY